MGAGRRLRTDGSRAGSTVKATAIAPLAREERRGDVLGIRAVHRAAFGRGAESRLVDQLRDDNTIVTSVVALSDGQVVANAVFSRLRLHTSTGVVSVAALAPVAVLPAQQRRGFGTAVIKCGLQICAENNCAAVFVLGDPDYYARFGFSHELAKRVSSPYSGAGSEWMALEIQPSSISNGPAQAEYPQAFSIVN